MDYNEIIDKISYIRNKSNLSARELSLRLVKNEGYINRLESKKDFLPRLEVLESILEICNVSEEEFFYHDIKSFKADMELISIFKDIPSNKKLAILTLLNKNY